MKRQIALGAVALVVVAALFFVLLLRPVTTQISETSKQVEAAKSEESSLRVQLRPLEMARQNATETAARLAKFDLLLPKTSDLPTFIRQVQEAANLSGIDLTSIAPSPPAALAPGPGVDPSVAGRGVFTLNVVLQISGGFFRQQSFLQRLENLQRVVLVSNLAVAPAVDAATGLFTLNSTITLQMFLVNPNAPVPGETPAPAPTPTSGQGGGGPATPVPTAS